MYLFEFCLALGTLGLTAMALLGLGAHGHAPPAQGHGPIGPQLGHAPGQAHLPFPTGGHATPGHPTGALREVAAASVEVPLWHFVWSFASPRVLFSVAFGFGLTGVVTRPYVGAFWAACAAAAGGVAFEVLAVAPLWRFLFRFASKPAQTLESALFAPARAVTGFDAEGHGLVAVELDGQVLQLLATLRPEDQAAGVRVRAGDGLRVEEIDDVRHRCRVSAR